MEDWTPRLKRYPHFDKYLPEDKILNIVTNPDKVATNPFFPFVLYNKKLGKFGRDIKVRPIRYACRKDSYIYSYYRHLLAKKYEERLDQLGIGEHPIAYRKVVAEKGSNSGKCNIHFAKESFLKIKEMGNCYAIALDISSYFESLDHKRLYNIWCDLIGKDELPSDHEAVFKNITKYSVVDLDRAYQRLGYIGEVNVRGRKKIGFTLNPKKIPMQLCSPKEFREKICGKGQGYEKLIEVNENDYGIPQGSPISDLLANIYLLDFDCKVSSMMKEVGGYYRRYSDDILVVCPKDCGDIKKIISDIKSLIVESGDNLIIKDSKTNITEFNVDGDDTTYTTLEPKGTEKPFEYLGFAFDGKVS